LVEPVQFCVPLAKHIQPNSFRYKIILVWLKGSLWCPLTSSGIQKFLKGLRWWYFSSDVGKLKWFSFDLPLKVKARRNQSLL